MVIRPDIDLIAQSKCQHPGIPTVFKVWLLSLEFLQEKTSSGCQPLSQGNGFAALPRIHTINGRIRNPKRSGSNSEWHCPRKFDGSGSGNKPQERDSSKTDD